VKPQSDAADFIGTLDGFVKVRSLASVVSLWRNEVTKREFAVKKFRFIADAEEAFKREVNSLCCLRHPLILSLVLCVLPEGGTGPRIVTEYLGGGSLSEILANPPRWWTATRKAITIAGIVVGMKYVHSCDMMHRDLKPSNILFDDARQVRIADFGSSRIYELDVTMTRAVGTPLYMAPELFAQDPQYSPKVDVYSFGLLLYEVVVGEGVLSTRERIVAAYGLLKKGNRPEIPSSVSEGVRDLICRCWSQDAESRPSFYEIYDTLESLKFEIVPWAKSESEVRRFLSMIEIEPIREEEVDGSK
jgi:serine/threonine protein kinase